MTVGGEPFAESADPDQFSVLPVDVRVVDDVTITKSDAADHGNWASYHINDPNAPPIQLLQRTVNRKRAVILVDGDTLNQQSLDGVIVSNSSDRLTSTGSHIGHTSGTGLGGFLAIGRSIVLENNEALYVRLSNDNNNGCIVTVLEERWDADQ